MDYSPSGLLIVCNKLFFDGFDRDKPDFDGSLDQGRPRSGAKLVMRRLLRGLKRCIPPTEWIRMGQLTLDYQLARLLQ